MRTAPARGGRRVNLTSGASSAPAGAAFFCTSSTGSADRGCAACPLHPWLHSVAPLGRNARRSRSLYFFHGFRGPRLRRLSASPVATVGRPAGAKCVSNGVVCRAAMCYAVLRRVVLHSAMATPRQSRRQDRELRAADRELAEVFDHLPILRRHFSWPSIQVVKTYLVHVPADLGQGAVPVLHVE